MSESIVTVDQAKKVARDVIASCKQFEQILRAVLGRKITLDYKGVEHIAQRPNDAWMRAVTPVVEGKYKGVFTYEQMLTIGNICARYIDLGDRHILIWGPCQGAKTMVFAGCFQSLPPLIKLCHGITAVPVVNMPNSINLSTSTVKEIGVVAGLYADVKIQLDGYEEGFNYVSVLARRLNTVDGTPKTWESLILQRNHSNINRFIEAAHKEEDDCTTICFTDEIHNGSEQGGVIDSWRDQFRLTHPEIELPEIGITATPSEVWGNHEWVIVPMWVPDNYMGITMYNGERLPTLSGKVPEVQKLYAIEESFPEFRDFLDLELFYDERMFYASALDPLGMGDDRPDYELLDQYDSIKLIELHQQYQYDFAKTLFDIYMRLVTKQHGIFFVRAFPTVEHSTLLLKKLGEVQEGEGYDDKYRILKYFGELDPIFGGKKRSESRSIREVLIDEYVRKDRFCMVLASKGRSRMGDSYPKECKHFFDMVENSVSWDAIIQSTLGRAQGFNKESICYFRRRYIDQFKEFYEGGCYDTKQKKPFGYRTVYTDKAQKGRPPRHDFVRFPDPDIKEKKP